MTQTLTDVRQLKNVVKKSSSATDNAIVRYDTTDGGLIQNSLAQIDDSGFLLGPGVRFVEGAAPATPLNAGEIIVYGKTDGKLYKKDNSGIETEVGGNAIYTKLSVVIPAGIGQTADITHNMNLPLAALKIIIRQTTTYLSETQKAAIFTASAPDNNTIRFTNVTALQQSFDAIVLSFKYQVTPADLDANFDISYILGAHTNEPTGVEKPSELGISFTNTSPNYTLTVTPSTATNIWYKGTKFVKSTPESLAIPTPLVSGKYFFYYNATGTLVVNAVNSAWNIYTDIPVALVYWNATTSKGIVFDERHGITMDGATHAYLHNAFGTQYNTGLAISGYVLNSDTLADVSIAISNGQIADEDIPLSITGYDVDPASFQTFYRNGANGDWEWAALSNLYFRNAVAGNNRIAYNTFTGGTWTQVEATNGNYINAWIVATDEWTFGDGTGSNGAYRLFAIQGQAQYNSLANAQAVSFNSEISVGDLPSVEFVPLYRITLQTNTAYNIAAGKGRIQGVTDIRRVNSPGSAATGAGAHNTLSGRSDASAHPASSIDASTSAFNSLLSVNESTVQLALDKIDDYAVIKPTVAPTDTSIVIFDGITGQLIKASNATIDGNGYIRTPNIDLATAVSGPATPSTSAILRFYTKNDSRLYTKNSTGTEATVAYLSDISGSNSSVVTTNFNGLFSNTTAFDTVQECFDFIDDNVVQISPSATDNAIVRFNMTTGRLIQNSLASVDDNGFVGTPALILAEGTTPAGTPTGTQLYLYSKSDHKLYTKNTASVEAAIPYFTDLTATNIAVTTTNFANLFANTTAFDTVQECLDYIDDNTVIKSTSATDNAIVRFDTTSGQKIQNSLATVDDNGFIGTPALIMTKGSTPSGTPGASELYVYAKTDGKVYKKGNDNIETQLGSGAGGSIRVNAYNSSDSTLPTASNPVFDGYTIQNGDLVLFSNLDTDNNRIYMAGNVTGTVTWTMQPSFLNGYAPTFGESVYVLNGTVYGGQTAVISNMGFWYINPKIRIFEGYNNSNFVDRTYVHYIALASNSADVTATPLTFQYTMYEGCFIDYKIKETSTGKVRVGRLFVAANSAGSAVSITDTYTETSTMDLTWNAVIDSGTSSILIQYTIGASGIKEMRADIKKIKAN